MNIFRRILHPIMALIAIQLIWITAVVFWIYWFIGKNREFRQLAEKYRPELLGQGANWPIMVEGLAMLVLILIGVYVIFVYWNRQSNLYLQQRNIISQVTHELKSPLASIQLHLETIRLRKPTEDRLDSFVDTMLADTERLHYLINNLLMAARLEQRRKQPERRMTDLTQLVSEHVERERVNLPQGGSISFEAAPTLKALVDPEEMSMVIRNLFENAVLYSPQSPEITVQLVKTGMWLQLSVQDRGRGLDKKELKNVFDRFYRVQPPGDNVRGTGLGLYIVESVIAGYGGTVWVTSDGPGKGCTFTVKFPAA
ncbi:MAG: HAMP domain-containing sensor histidine kinase [Desulfuromonadaceae bacterium]|nr:HAMP domain-containing sensor histidine kinase [Desulfuromonadaceae bacterium]MDD2849845.1 HAMP domain-containing sensor histidine kinase [Desulfuromonadaceae bacterium]MDD4131616.1 HAMP domain-containing sensor histidine kinase [Desulfuromonadaceae bacterium]